MLYINLRSTTSSRTVPANDNLQRGNNVSAHCLTVFHHPVTAFRSPSNSSAMHPNCFGASTIFSSIKLCPKRCFSTLLSTYLDRSPQPISIVQFSRCALFSKPPALSLGQRCEYDASCKWTDKFSECAKEEQRCRCIHNYMPKVNLTHGTSCVQSR